MKFYCVDCKKFFEAPRTTYCPKCNSTKVRIPFDTDVQIDRAEPKPGGFTYVEEVDPDGVGQHTPGAKLDAGKVRVGLMFKCVPRALMEVARVFTYGAEKYTPGGCLKVKNGIERYSDAEGRHLLEGHIEDFDPESELLHLSHKAWNALMILELYIRDQEVAGTKNLIRSEG